MDGIGRISFRNLTEGANLVSSPLITSIGNLSVSYTPSSDESVRLAMFSTYGTANPSATTVYEDIQLEIGSTATEYEPYQGHTYTTDLGRTVYGGTLDVVTGELVVDRAMVDLGTLNWIAHGTYASTFYAEVSGKRRKSTKFISSAYANGGLFSNYANIENGTMYASSGDNSRIAVKNTAYTTASDFKAAMNGVQLAYELAEPQTIQLTPQQVALLMGTNNVWSDAGEVTVVYTKALPQSGSVTLLEGVYYVTYTAEDECGNKTEVTRRIVVGDGNELCKMRLCEGFADCSQNRTCEAYTCQAYTACE